MKKVWIYTAAALVAVSAISFPAFAATSMTLQEAETLAAKYVPEGSTKLWSEYDDRRYEVSFYNDTLKEEYEVKVDPTTGKVTDFDSDLVGGYGAQQATLSEDSAKKVVTDEIPDAEIEWVYLERDDGLQQYKVRFSTDSYYGTYEIHPVNGTVLERDIKAGVHPSNTTASGSPSAATSSGSTTASGATGSGSYISADRAKQIAQAQAPSATLYKCKMDFEHGRMVYEIEGRDGWIEYEFEIDALTGQILKSEMDYDD